MESREHLNMLHRVWTLTSTPPIRVTRYRPVQAWRRRLTMYLPRCRVPLSLRLRCPLVLACCRNLCELRFLHPTLPLLPHPIRTQCCIPRFSRRIVHRITPMHLLPPQPLVTVCGRSLQNTPTSPWARDLPCEQIPFPPTRFSFRGMGIPSRFPRWK